MNSQTAFYTITNTERKVTQIEQRMERLETTIQDMMRMLAPIFCQTDDNNLSQELIEPTMQGIT